MISQLFQRDPNIISKLSQHDLKRSQHDIRMVENKFDVNKEIDKRINSEIDRQLNELSLVFFNKVKQKIIISEL